MSDVKGVLFVLFSEVLLAGVNVIVKLLKSWGKYELMAVRAFFDLMLCVGLCAVCRYSFPEPKMVARLLMRGMAYVSFIACLWGGLRSCLPIGDVMVVVVAVSPIFLVVLTRTLLGEEIPRTWPLQVSLCMTGALLVEKPMTPLPGCSPLAALWPLGAAFFGAVMNFMSRNVKEVPPAIVMASNDVVALVFATTLILLQGGEGPSSSIALPQISGWDLGVVAVAATIGWVGLMSNVKGYQTVSVAAVASIAAYAAVPLGYMMQVLVFGQVPDVKSVVGAMLIVSANVGVTLYNYRASQAAAAGSLEEGKGQAYKQLPGGEDEAKALGA